MTTDTIVRVDPKTLLIGPNVRKEVDLTEGFLESIKESGVRTPIEVVETPEGYVVIDGQRRTLAAIDVELEQVPVYITAKQTEDQRIVDQVVVNVQRKPITEGEAIAAVQELALFDMAVPAIAKKTGLRPDLVEQAVRVGKSNAAKAAIAEHELRFDYAVTIAEFDEYPEEQKQLLQIVKGGNHWNLSNKAREFNDARAERAVKAQIKAVGLKVVAQPTYYTNDPRAIDSLYTTSAMTKTLASLAHDKLVALAGDGLVAYPTQEWVDGSRQWVIGYAVQGWQERTGIFGRVVESSSNAPATPEDAEKLKAERRVARENTKAWVASTPARIEFLQTLVARKAMPKGWEPLVIGLTLQEGSSSSSAAWKMTGVILRLKEAKDAFSYRGSVARELASRPTAALQIGLAAWAGSIEGSFEFERKGWSREISKKYLLQLETWGYTLSDVEWAATGRKPRKVTAAA